MLLEMKVSGLTIDPTTNAPIVILKDKAEKNALPVWIGILEASAIATELEKIHFSRPMTHDLLKEVIDAMKGIVTRVVVNDLKENVYYATIHMSSNNGLIHEIDSRPSDAIALALRAGCPIFVDSSVLDKSKHMDLKPNEADAGAGEKSYEGLLEDLKDKDFGKYKM